MLCFYSMSFIYIFPKCYTQYPMITLYCPMTSYCPYKFFQSTFYEGTPFDNSKYLFNALKYSFSNFSISFQYPTFANIAKRELPIILYFFSYFLIRLLCPISITICINKKNITQLTMLYFFSTIFPNLYM